MRWTWNTLYTVVQVCDAACNLLTESKAALSRTDGEEELAAGRLLPSLRYDTLIHQPDGGLVFSVTAARGGDPVFLHYPHVDHAGRLFVSYHHERADVSRQFKEQISSRWIWRTDGDPSRTEVLRIWVWLVGHRAAPRAHAVFVRKISFVECLMKLLHDSAERLINNCSASDSDKIIIVSRLWLKLLMSLSGLLGWG